ncbi:MAG: gliding motility protein GldN [Prevotella sp.]|jgi:gliding motility associated protien GldN|nr:gliding motility protein GldN [Prevotella sp.]
MRKILFLIMCACLSAGLAEAQPKARQQQQTKTTSNRNNMTMRAQLSFPTEQKMDEDVVWRRDVYRELDLNDDANAPLYYPTEPVGTQMNLFTYIFKLVMAGPNHGGIAAYSYDVNSGSERFDESLRVKPLKFLDDYHIFYERTDRGVHIDDSDIPSAEVKAYYIKESSYYDQNTSSFHTRVQALCPVMFREDDFGDGVTKYPLFWIRYDDLAPFLSKQTIMTSNLNNAATMSIDDYFTLNAYKGKIYKTTNMLGKTLAQTVGSDSVKLSKEQRRIEKEIADFEKNIWGDQARKDSLDSIAKLDPKQQRALQKKNRRSGVGTTKTVRTRTSRGSSTATTGAARITVRRQRH